MAGCFVVNAPQDDPVKLLWRLRRRLLWPAYVTGAIIAALMVSNGAENGWMLLVGLVLALLAFDISISARIYVLREQTLEAGIMWFAVVLAVFATCFSLFTWFRRVTDGG